MAARATIGRDGLIDAESDNLKQKLALIDAPWQPRVIAELNDYQLKLARLEGEFVWHAHEHTDEMFLCLNGELTIQTDAGDVILHEGEVYAVPRGVRHRPCAGEECEVLVIEPRGVFNTGDAASDRTHPMMCGSRV